MENKIKNKGHHEFLSDLDLTLAFNPTIQSKVKAKKTEITFDDDSFPFVPFSQANTALTKKSKKTAKI